ncbi:Pantothenate synthetase [compost metagenome]
MGEPTVRAADGLALSSRNGYLSAEQRASAPQLYQTLNHLAEALRAGRSDYSALLAEAGTRLQTAGFAPDYLEIRNPLTLRPAGSADRQLVILAAARLGATRLIDNLLVDLDATA